MKRWLLISTATAAGTLATATVVGIVRAYNESAAVLRMMRYVR